MVLKNPEYAITQAIRKVVDEYRAGGNPFESLTEPRDLPRLPFARRQAARRRCASSTPTCNRCSTQMQKQAGGKLKVAFEDPDGDGGKLATQLKQRYGFGPQIASLLDTHPFWFYMVLTRDGSSVQVPLPDTLDQAALQALARSGHRAHGAGLPEDGRAVRAAGLRRRGSLRYTRLDDALAANERIVNTDLKSGHVPADADLLLVLAPQSLDDKQRFAIDQFLMQGGSVVIATSPFDVQFGDSLTATKVDSGLKDWLAQMGVGIGDTMVLDTRDAALPIPVQRDLGGIPVREIRMLPYPQFPDLRGAGLDPQNPITENLGQLTVNWASPISIDATKNKSRSVAELLKSSPQSWTSAGLDVIPDYRAHPDTGFAVTGERKPRLLAVALQGRFDSFYAGKPSPLATAAARRRAGRTRTAANPRTRVRRKGRALRRTRMPPPTRRLPAASSTARPNRRSSSSSRATPSRPTERSISRPRGSAPSTPSRSSSCRTRSTGRCRTRGCSHCGAAPSSRAP